jgi:DNA-binding GntR family transcriptional regulator
MQEHEDLMDAFKDRNSARAHKIWRRHLMNTGLAITSAQLADLQARPQKALEN